MTSKIIFILVITAMISYSVATNLPPVCQSSEQCPPGYCCTLRKLFFNFFSHLKKLDVKSCFNYNYFKKFFIEKFERIEN